MTGLLLVGASGLALEVLAAQQSGGGDVGHVLVDDDPGRWRTDLAGVPVIGGLEEIKAHPDHRVLVCPGAGSARRSLVARLTELGVAPERYARFIHPSVDVPAGCSVGPGSVLLAGTVLTADVRIGAHVVVMPNCTLTHGTRVHDYATLCAGVSLGGDAVVGEAAYLGMNSSVRQEVVVGGGATLGMGAVLVRDLPPSEVWTGVPARPLTGGMRS